MTSDASNLLYHDDPVNLLYREALSGEFADLDSYIAEWGTSIIFAPPEDDPNAEIDVDFVVSTLTSIWETANAPFKTLLERMGLNQSQCAARFGIPLRTVQGWALGERTPPPYLRLMMAQLMGFAPTPETKP